MQEAISVSATRNRSRCAARGQAVKRRDSYGHRATAAVGSIFLNIHIARTAGALLRFAGSPKVAAGVRKLPSGRYQRAHLGCIK